MIKISEHENNQYLNEVVVIMEIYKHANDLMMEVTCKQEIDHGDGSCGGGT